MTVHQVATNAASVSSWLCEPYGAPCPKTSEVSHCVGYYSVEALVAFGTGTCD